MTNSSDSFWQLIPTLYRTEAEVHFCVLKARTRDLKFVTVSSLMILDLRSAYEIIFQFCRVLSFKHLCVITNLSNLITGRTSSQSQTHPSQYLQIE